MGCGILLHATLGVGEAIEVRCSTTGPGDGDERRMATGIHISWRWWCGAAFFILFTTTTNTDTETESSHGP